MIIRFDILQILLIIFVNNFFRFVLLNFPCKFLMNIFTLVHIFFLLFHFGQGSRHAGARIRGPQMVQGSFPFLPLPSIFLRTPRPYGEARHFFANKPRARFWQRNNCCQLGRDIVPPRCETASFFQGILAYLYPSLPRIRT